MKNNTFNTIIGVLTAIIIAGLIIFSIEEKKSFLQILIAFIIFIIPVTFISSFTTKTMSFLLTSMIIFVTYLSYKFEYHDIWIGVVQALVIGGAIYFFKIRKTKTFSPNSYKKNEHE